MIRFTGKVKVVDDCWEWQAGFRGKTGYGAFKYKGKVIDAHRMSYRLFIGPIPDGILVCHTCDNRKCVNPAHLFLGTYKDNYHDGRRKGRIKSPENIGENLKKHPSIGAYNRGCRCESCKQIKNDYTRNWRRKRNPALVTLK